MGFSRSQKPSSELGVSVGTSQAMDFCGFQWRTQSADAADMSYIFDERHRKNMKIPVIDGKQAGRQATYKPVLL